MEEKKEEIIEIKPEEKKEEEKKTAPEKDRKGLGIASMVLGIIALVFFFIFYISIPCGILAIVFGVLAIKSTGREMAIAGLVTGSIGFVLTVLIFIALIIFGFAAAFTDIIDVFDTDYNYRHEYYDDYNDYD